MDEEDDGDQEEEFEVEDILRYRRNEDGTEQFLVKWQGYSEQDSTWEPLAHMNDNCRELIAKARALFSFRCSGLSSGEVVVSQNPLAATVLTNEPVAAAPSVPAPAASPSPTEAPQPSAISIIEEREDVEVGAQPGLDQAQPAQEEEEEEEEEDTEAEEMPPEASQPAEPSRGAGGVDEEISIIEDDDDLPANASVDTAPRPTQAANKRPQEPAASFVGAPSDPRMKRPRLIPPSADGGTAGTLEGTVPARPKVTGGAGTNGVRHVPSATVPLTTSASGGAEPSRIPEPPKPPSREIKCICGVNEVISPNRPTSDLIVCRSCNCSLHINCVKPASGTPASLFVCPPCRLERVDEFHPTVGAGLLKHSYATCSNTFSLTFTAQAAQWKKQCWAVHLRSVHIQGGDLSGPAWPHKVQGKLNGRQCVAIDPPKHLHVRREQCYNLTPLLKQGLNTLELRFFPKPDKPRDEAEDNYCVGVVLTRPRSVASIISRIRARSQETVSSGRARVERLLAQVARMEAGQEDECAVTGNFGRTLKPLCPVSHCPIEEAAIGRDCHHIQVFDLQAYIAVNQRMRSLDKRWTCPVCGSALRPDDVILHPFAQGILDTLRGDEDMVEAIVFNEDCSWSTISVAKDENRGEDGEEGSRAEMIDLSD